MNTIKSEITLGSLFDGIGAVPLAASYFGIKTLWASEILPNAVSVTQRHFPHIEHLGDITKIDGGKIPPVQIIAFGSPCQSWSVAGNRTGLEGKSGLFMEAIRIIREMREATNGKYPQIALFENVVGLLNCGAGGRSNYQAVLEAFCQAEIPMPESGRWANTGMVRGRGIDLAWIVKDASKHFRVPQRRKRLFLIADFTGQRAGEILFKSKSLSGYFATRESEGERAAADAESSTGSAITIINDQGGESLNIEKEEISPTLRSQSHGNLPIVCAAFMAGQAKNARSIAYSETVSPTLKGSLSGLNQMPCICEPTAYGICSDKSNSMLSDNPNSGVYKADTSRTLDTSCLNPACNQGGMVIVEPQIARTLTARGDSSPCVDRGQNIVVFAENQRSEVRDLGGIAGCLSAEPGMKQQTYIMQTNESPDSNSLTPWEAQGTRVFGTDGVSPTLAGADMCGGRNPAGLVLAEAPPSTTVHPEISGTLCASGAGLSRPAGNANETDLCVAYCLQGNMTGGNDTDHQHKDVTDSVCMPTVFGQSQYATYKEGCATLRASGGDNGGGSENLVTETRTPHTGYIVRRLTPTEAERLMSLPDDWTTYGHDGKQMSDSARYSMCGNSIVVNVLAYIMQNIADALSSEGG